MSDVTLVQKDYHKIQVFSVVLSQVFTNMDYICKYNKFGFCKLKDQCKKYHVNEACKEGSFCGQITICPLRHPKLCKRIVMEEHCKFQERCAYNHKRRHNIQFEEKHELHEDVKNLKAELDILKTTFKSILSVRAEVEFLNNSLKYIKEEINS